MDCNQEKTQGHFPGVPVVRTLPSNAGGVGSVPGWEAIRSHMPVAKKQNIKQKRCCNEFNKDFKKNPCYSLSSTPSHTAYTSLFSISASPFCSVTQSCLTLLQPYGLQPARPLCPWDFPGKNTGVGYHFLLQGIFHTQGLN